MADAASRLYGDANPVLTGTVTGFKNSETSAVVTTAPTCSSSYAPTSAVSSSPTTQCSGAAAANYTFSYTNGHVTISPATDFGPTERALSR